MTSKQTNSIPWAPDVTRTDGQRYSASLPHVLDILFLYQRFRAVTGNIHCYVCVKRWVYLTHVR